MTSDALSTPGWLFLCCGLSGCALFLRCDVSGCALFLCCGVSGCDVVFQAVPYFCAVRIRYVRSFGRGCALFCAVVFQAVVFQAVPYFVS